MQAPQIDNTKPCRACGHAATITEPCCFLEAPTHTADCRLCAGTGTMRWCPTCGRNYWAATRAQQTAGGEVRA